MGERKNGLLKQVDSEKERFGEEGKLGTVFQQ